MNNFYCLMASGMPFSQDISNFLIDTARYMHQENKEVFDFKTESVEGKLSTKNRFYLLSSSVNGIQFEADLECEAGKTKVVFLVPKKFLESNIPSKWQRGEWKRINFNTPARTAHLN